MLALGRFSKRAVIFPLSSPASGGAARRARRLSGPGPGARGAAAPAGGPEPELPPRPPAARGSWVRTGWRRAGRAHTAQPRAAARRPCPRRDGPAGAGGGQPELGQRSGRIRGGRGARTGARAPGAAAFVAPRRGRPPDPGSASAGRFGARPSRAPTGSLADVSWAPPRVLGNFGKVHMKYVTPSFPDRATGSSKV